MTVASWPPSKAVMVAAVNFKWDDVELNPGPCHGNQLQIKVIDRSLAVNSKADTSGFFLA
jgi:hypothetical protein